MVDACRRSFSFCYCILYLSVFVSCSLPFFPDRTPYRNVIPLNVSSVPLKYIGDPNTAFFSDVYVGKYSHDCVTFLSTPLLDQAQCEAVQPLGCSHNLWQEAAHHRFLEKRGICFSSPNSTYDTKNDPNWVNVARLTALDFHAVRDIVDVYCPILYFTTGPPPILVFSELYFSLLIKRSKGVVEFPLDNSHETSGHVCIRHVPELNPLLTPKVYNSHTEFVNSIPIGIGVNDTYYRKFNNTPVYRDCWMAYNMTHCLLSSFSKTPTSVYHPYDFSKEIPCDYRPIIEKVGDFYSSTIRSVIKLFFKELAIGLSYLFRFISGLVVSFMSNSSNLIYTVSFLVLVHQFGIYLGLALYLVLLFYLVPNF